MRLRSIYTRAYTFPTFTSFSTAYTTHTDHARTSSYKDSLALPHDAQPTYSPQKPRFKGYYLIRPHDHPYLAHPAYLPRIDNLM
jgi:hypothetical protein